MIEGFLLRICVRREFLIGRRCWLGFRSCCFRLHHFGDLGLILFVLLWLVYNQTKEKTPEGKLFAIFLIINRKTDEKYKKTLKIPFLFLMQLIKGDFLI